MTSSPRFSLPSLALALVFVGALLIPTQAQAVDFQAGLGGQFGINSVTSDEDAYNPSFGFGGGGQVFATIRPFALASFGLNFDASYYSHTDDSTTPEANVSFFLPSVGLIVRALGVNPKKGQPTSGWGGALTANYQFGSATRDDGVNRIDQVEYEGFQLGLQALYGFRIAPYKTMVEVGAYAKYNFATLETETQDPNNPDVRTIRTVDANSFQIGIILQMVFQFGI